jgi:hypothetical protein
VSVDDLQTLRSRIDYELRRKESRPDEPSFGMSEGTRAELENREEVRKRNPEAADRMVVASPFTGAELDENGKRIADVERVAERAEAERAVDREATK